MNRFEILRPEAGGLYRDALRSLLDKIQVHFRTEAAEGRRPVFLRFFLSDAQNQAAALMEVAAGTSDAAVIDALMAGAMVGEGTSYADLGYTLPLNEEQYGVGFRTGSDLAEELDAFLDAAIADGSLLELAEAYGVEAALITE